MAEPQPTIFDDSEENEVQRILNSKRRYRKLYYHVQWAGYNYLRTTWEPAQNLENLQKANKRVQCGEPGEASMTHSSDAMTGASATYVRSVRNALTFLMALAALTEPRDI